MKSSYLFPLLALSMVVVPWCAGRKPVERPEKKSLTMETKGDTIEVSLDINDDKIPDVWNTYKKTGDGGKVLVNKRSDLNLDGKVDVTTAFDNEGVITKEEIDADFDGRVDWIDYYDKGKRIKSEIDKNFDGSFDTWKFFENEKIVRKERDTNNDGKPDYFEYYENEEVIRIGRDFNNDGVVDRWE